MPAAHPTFAGETVRLSTEDLAREVAKDLKAANEKFKGVVVEVDGPIDLANRRQFQDRVTILGTSKPRHIFNCVLTPESRAKIDELGKGQAIKVRGKYSVSVNGVTFVNGCTILEVGKSTLIRIGAEELAKEVAANPLAAFKKFYNKELVVDGEVLDTTSNDKKVMGFVVKERIITLRTTEGKTKVFADLTDADFQKVTKGQRVRVRGLVLTGSDSVQFISPYLLPLPAEKESK